MTLEIPAGMIEEVKIYGRLLSGDEIRAIYETRPFPNEHAARLKNPNNFAKDTFRRKKDGKIYGSIEVPKTVAVIWGKLKGKAAPGDMPIPQSLRFLTSDWTVASAKKWLKDNKVKYTLFEPASESKSLNGEGERRNLTDVEIRVVDGDNGNPTIHGYAAIFGAESEGLPFREIIEQGAFTESVLKDDIVGLFNHDPSFVLGRKSSKTMRVEEDTKGLRFEIDPPDTGMGRDVPVLIKRGDVKGASFRFLVKPGGEHWEGEGEELTRHLTNLRLMDVSPATFPAYPSTSVAARSLDHYLEERETAECEPAWRTELRRLRLEIEKTI